VKESGAFYCFSSPIFLLIHILTHTLPPSLPPHHTQLYINSIQIGYNIFLSFLGNKKIDEPEVVKEAEAAVASAVDKVKDVAK
jgi:hypothetical protein